MTCHIDRNNCAGCEFSKEGLCDWPWRQGMSYEENQQITRRMVYFVDERLIERLLSRFEITESGCWEWQGARLSHGYGVIALNKKVLKVHRVSCEFFNGEIPENYEVDHLCRNRACINPAHLKAVTREENARRIVSGQSAKTHCPKGHPYDEENTYVYKQTIGGYGRLCKTCLRERGKSNLHRNKKEEIVHG